MVEGQPAHPARQSPLVWLAKVEGPDGVCSDSQRDLTSGMSQVNSSAQRARGRVVDPRGQSSAWRGTNVLARAISLTHPQPKSLREPVPIKELACTAQTPNAVLLWIHPSDGSASLLVLQGPSRRGPMT